MDTAKVAIRGSTQEYLEIADLRDGLVLLKDGSVALVIRVSAVNFGLLSEKEQEAIIFAYAGLINSLNFPIQIVIRSQRKDISHYVSLLSEEEKKQINPLLKNQISSYRRFVMETVKENNVLDKKFYVVVPFSSLELGIGTKLPPEAILERAKVALMPKKDHLLRQLGRLGLAAKQLATAELIELFYEIYSGGVVAPKNGPTPAKFEQITS